MANNNTLDILAGANNSREERRAKRHARYSPGSLAYANAMGSGYEHPMPNYATAPTAYADQTAMNYQNPNLMGYDPQSSSALLTSGGVPGVSGDGNVGLAGLQQPQGLAASGPTVTQPVGTQSTSSAMPVLNTGMNTNQDNNTGLAGLDLNTGFAADGQKTLEEGLGLSDYMNMGQAGVNMASGLAGIYGGIQQNQRAKEAMDVARSNLALNQQAANQYSQFRNETKNAFK